MEVLVTVLVLLVPGFALGALYMRWRNKPTDVVGNLMVDESEPGNPLLYLELSKTLQDVRSKKYVKLKVNTINYIPHE